MSSPWSSMCAVSSPRSSLSTYCSSFRPFPLPHLQEVHGKPEQLRQGGCGHQRRPLLTHREDRSGQPGKETGLFEASDHYYHEQFMESFSSTDYSKLDYDRAWSSQEWKAEATTHDRSGQPDKTSWRMVQQVRPDHEEVLLDGTAQSVRYGETLRDRATW